MSELPESGRLVRAGLNGELGDADDVVTNIEPTGVRTVDEHEVVEARLSRARRFDLTTIAKG